MKNCNYCGAPLDDDALFCRKCGKEIGTGKKCPRCGAEERADSLFCAKCGMRLDAQKIPFMFPIQEEVQTNEGERRKNRVPKKVINIVLAAVLLAFLYWIWQSGSSQSTQKMNFAIQNVDSTTFVIEETNNNAIGISIDNTQRFGIHKVYLADNGFEEQTVKVEPATSFSIKKDNRILWAKYIIGNGEVTIKASANTTTKNRSCDFVLIDYNGNPVDTLEVIQAGKVSTTSGRNKSYMVSTASTPKAISTTTQRKTSTTTQKRTSTTTQRRTSTTTQRRASSTSQSSYRDQCAAITQKGTRCLRKASSGSIYCWQHK